MEPAPWYVSAGFLFGGCGFVCGASVIAAVFSPPWRREDLRWATPLAAFLLTAWVWLPFVLYGVHRVGVWTVNTPHHLEGAQ